MSGCAEAQRRPPPRERPPPPPPPPGERPPPPLNPPLLLAPEDRTLDEPRLLLARAPEPLYLSLPPLNAPELPLPLERPELPLPLERSRPPMLSAPPPDRFAS